MSLDETWHLLGEALDGGGDARGRLMERLRPRVLFWATTRLSPAMRAKMEPDDVAQEILLRVHKDLDGFERREPRGFYAWLFHVGENCIRDLVDREQALKRRTPEPRSFSQTSPSGALRRLESVERLRGALEKLPPDYQEVIRLRRFQELDTAEVARLMERSENAVRVLYCRALKALARELRPPE